MISYKLAETKSLLIYTVLVLLLNLFMSLDWSFYIFFLTFIFILLTVFPDKLLSLYYQFWYYSGLDTLIFRTCSNYHYIL